MASSSPVCDLTCRNAITETGLVSTPSYRSLTLAQFAARLSDGVVVDTEDRVFKHVRITQSYSLLPLLRSYFAIGQAYYAVTASVQGFLCGPKLLVSSPGGCCASNGVGALPALPLCYTAADGTYSQLTCPRSAILVDAHAAAPTIYVCGAGIARSVSGEESFAGPGIAVVCLTYSACDGTWLAAVQSVVIGNGTTNMTDEIYTDIKVAPCAQGSGSVNVYGAPTLLVCSTGTLVDNPDVTAATVAAVRRLNAVTFLSLSTVVLQVEDVGLSVAARTMTMCFPGVSLPDVLVVAVNFGDPNAEASTGALLWPVVTATTGPLATLTPWSATAYNDGGVLQPRLALPAGAIAVTLLSVFVSPSDDGDVFAIGNVLNDPAADALPTHSAVVYRWQASTHPTAWWGQGGVLTWFDPLTDSGSTRCTGGTLIPSPGSGIGSCLVLCGNVWTTELVTPLPDPTVTPYATYTVPCFEAEMTVHTLLSPPYNIPYTPSPFAIMMSTNYCASVPRCFPNILANINCGDCALIWISSVCPVTSLDSSFVIVGDVCTHWQTTAQAAGVFQAVYSGYRRLQSEIFRKPMLTYGCNGTVVVDAGCASTALQVRGPVIVSSSPDSDCLGTPIPGMIRYDATTDSFQGFTRTSGWVTLGGGAP